VLDLSIRKQLAGFRLDARLEIADSGLTALFGRSGAGKTSIIAAIAGLLKPDEGHVRIAGRTLYDASRGIDVPVHERRIGYVFQESRLFPHLSVRDNLLYGHRRAPAGERRIGEAQVVRLLGLEALLAHRPATLSGGEKQRVAIGRALLAQPAALLMDEPLASLDAPRKREILPYLERLRDEWRLSIVYVSHALDEVMRLASHMAVIEAGRVIAAGTPESLTQRLELQPFLGGVEAGSVLDVTVTGHDLPYELTTLAFDGGSLRVPRIDRPVGTQLRVQVHARDVAIALDRPSGLSIQNMLPATVAELTETSGAYAEVKLATGSAFLIARITRESAHRLDLAAGRAVFALIKSVALQGDAALAEAMLPTAPASSDRRAGRWALR
jgi:molybdate transport system ATP-binding protein